MGNQTETPCRCQRTMVLLSSMRHSWAKLLTLLVAVPNLPLTVDAMLPFMLVGLLSTLLLHTVAPNKVVVPLKLRDWAVIAVNLGITGGSAVGFVHLIKDDIQEVDSLLSVDPKQLLYIPLWILSDEVLFFHLHRYAHQKGIYDCMWPGPGHKMHHKFKVTNAWTSFYAHPVDHLIDVTWAALLAPLIQITVLKHAVSVPVIVLFMFGAITSFVASHHTVIGQDDPEIAEGTPHLQHHTRFNVNFGNFGYFDQISGSFGSVLDPTAKKSARIIYNKPVSKKTN